MVVDEGLLGEITSLMSPVVPGNLPALVQFDDGSPSRWFRFKDLVKAPPASAPNPLPDDGALVCQDSTGASVPPGGLMARRRAVDATGVKGGWTWVTIDKYHWAVSQEGAIREDGPIPQGMPNRSTGATRPRAPWIQLMLHDVAECRIRRASADGLGFHGVFRVGLLRGAEAVSFLSGDTGEVSEDVVAMVRDKYGAVVMFALPLDRDAVPWDGCPYIVDINGAWVSDNTGLGWSSVDLL